MDYKKLFTGLNGGELTKVRIADGWGNKAFLFRGEPPVWFDKIEQGDMKVSTKKFDYVVEKLLEKYLYHTVTPKTVTVEMAEGVYEELLKFGNHLTRPDFLEFSALLFPDRKVLASEELFGGILIKSGAVIVGLIMFLQPSALGSAKVLTPIEAVRLVRSRWKPSYDSKKGEAESNETKKSGGDSTNDKPNNRKSGNKTRKSGG
jgi:hypothetical protein